jgi:hypothetical protein
VTRSQLPRSSGSEPEPQAAAWLPAGREGLPQLEAGVAPLLGLGMRKQRAQCNRAWSAACSLEMANATRDGQMPVRAVRVAVPCGSGAFILSSPVCTVRVIVGNPAASALKAGFGCVCCRPLSADSCRPAPFGSCCRGFRVPHRGAPSRPSTGIASRGGARLRTVSKPRKLPAAETSGRRNLWLRQLPATGAHSPERLQPAGAAHAAGHSNRKGR